MSENKEIVYSEPKDYFPEEIRKEYKLGEYAEEDTLEDCAGIQPIPMIEEPDKTKSVSKDKEAEIRRRLRGRAAEYLMFMED